MRAAMTHGGKVTLRLTGEADRSLQFLPGPPVPNTRARMPFLIATNTILSARNVACKISAISDMVLNGMYLL